jgi:hypothetical protein
MNAAVGERVEVGFRYVMGGSYERDEWTGFRGTVVRASGQFADVALDNGQELNITCSRLAKTTK